MTQTPSNHSELASQLILLFYGAEALHEYRQDNDLIPITVHQGLKVINVLRVSDLEKLKESLPEKRKSFTDEWEKHQKFGYNKALDEVHALINKQIQELK